MIRFILLTFFAGWILACLANARIDNRPNIVLMMADDLGYGDTGFNGNKIIQTPYMDNLAEQGVVLTHFYAGNAVCSPTRATCLTGRHHDRMGIWFANQGHLPAQEITLAKILKDKGYTTGHFGKWHLGTLDREISSKGKNRKPALNYSPPWERDYDVSFVTESAVSTWNPGLGKRAVNNPFYENGVALDGKDESLLGGAARVVVDRVVPFIEKAAAVSQPFLAVVWFHAPHEDIEAGPQYLEMYQGHGEGAHYYGCITEMDEQVGRIHTTLENAGIAGNTLIFFCSDNGPEGSAQLRGRRVGVTDGLRGRKRDLYDGGVRVPAFAVWPDKIEPGTSNDTILSTLDYFPTIRNIVGYEMPDTRPIDGENILPVLIGKTHQRAKAIPFRARGIGSLVRNGFKFLLPSRELFDLTKDWPEENNLAASMPGVVANMERELIATFESIKKSHAGDDYGDPSFKPVDSWRPLVISTDENNRR